MAANVAGSPWMGFPGSIDRKYFNTETERGPQRVTEKASMPLRARFVVRAERRPVSAGTVRLVGTSVGRRAVWADPRRFSVALSGPHSVSVLKFYCRKRHCPRPASWVERARILLARLIFNDQPLHRLWAKGSDRSAGRCEAR